MIIVSITGPSMRDALRQLSASAPWADLFELRLDLIGRPVLASLIAAATKPVIATCRPEWEGGGYAGGERDRREMLEAASLLGAAYVDLELGSGVRTLREFLGRSGETAVIVSAHRPVAGKRGVESLYRRMRSTGAGVLKLAFPADDAAQLDLVRHFLQLAKTDRQRAVCMAIGEAGEASRVLYRKLGGWATYAAAESGPEAAPGQIRASVLRDLYHADALTTRTRVYGVIGNPVQQSKGILVHNPLMRRAGADAVYCRFAVTHLRRFMAGVAPMLDGFSVTKPLKEAVLPFLETLDSTAQAIGAVNTVIRTRRGWHGLNTDAAGALDAIEGTIRVQGKRVLLLGAGGAARAIACEARRRGAVVLVAGRTRRKARALAREFGLKDIALSACRRTGFDLLINATPVGMAPAIHATPYPWPIPAGSVVFDAVYTPPMTRLLREAERSGATIIPGTEMYLHQAARQSALYTGVQPSGRVIRKLLSASFNR
jgi:3-dehydroquinate dehydratase / shikimate dehydrogenase